MSQGKTTRHYLNAAVSFCFGISRYFPLPNSIEIKTHTSATDMNSPPLDTGWNGMVSIIWRRSSVTFLPLSVSSGWLFWAILLEFRVLLVVLVLDVFLDFVLFSVVCVSPGPNVDLHVIQCRRKNGTNRRIQASGRKLVFMKNDLKLRLLFSCHMIFCFPGHF